MCMFHEQSVLGIDIEEAQATLSHPLKPQEIKHNAKNNNESLGKILKQKTFKVIP